MRKTYIDVELRWKKDGTIIPIALWWEEAGNDPKKFIIDKVISGPVSCHVRSGGVAKRYLIKIRGNQRALYHEKDRWFLETEES